MIKSWQPFIKQAEKKLQILDDAEKLTDLSRLRGNRFEKLLGDRKGQYSIRINDKWRVCFRWKYGEPYDVEIVNYHD